MAVETFGVTPDDVLDALALNTRAVGSASAGLNTTKLEAWIKSGAAHIQALLERAQVDMTDAAAADSPAREIARDAIINYATARALEVALNNPADPRIERAWERWNSARALFKDYPGDLGDATPSSARIKHNVDLTASLPLGSFRNTKW